MNLAKIIQKTQEEISWDAATKFFNNIGKITYRENSRSYKILQQHVGQHPMFAKKTEFCVARGQNPLRNENVTS